MKAADLLMPPFEQARSAKFDYKSFPPHHGLGALVLGDRVVKASGRSSRVRLIKNQSETDHFK